MPKSKKKKIVCLGGGNAMPNTVLKGLKGNLGVDLWVISAVFDSGGSAGEERKKYNTNISYGDIRRAALELSKDQKIKDIFSTRIETKKDQKKAIKFLKNIPLGDIKKDIEKGKLKGHVIANIFGTATEVNTNNPDIAIEELSKKLKVSHHLLLATPYSAILCAEGIDEQGNKQEIEGEENIDVPKHKKKLKIKNVYLKPQGVKANPKAISVIKDADLILIGPGDLYSSLVQTLLIKDISKTIKENKKSKKIYICNLMTKKGETDDFTVSDFTDEIEKYLGGEVDYVIYNTKKPEEERILDYKRSHEELIELVDFKNLPKSKKFIGNNLLISGKPIVHCPKKLAKTILNLCKR